MVVTKTAYLVGLDESMSMEVVSDVSNETRWAWCRGVFDNQGYVGRYNGHGKVQVRITSDSKQFLEGLQRKFLPQNKSEIFEAGTTYLWSISKWNELRYIATKMYRDNGPCVESKREKFVEYGLLSI